MYTEEEVYNLLIAAVQECDTLCYHYNGDYKDLQKWFKQHKK